MQSTGQSTMRWLRGLILGILMPLLFGVNVFVLGDSHWQAIRSSDMVKLIGLGFCWGIGFTELLGLIGPKFRK